jgi:glycosyltransferase involved in cell wall biosynthesis
MSSPRVSVLVTTRNGAATIGKSLDSILRQTMGDFELLVVDDGSVDGTPAILAAIDDPRLRVLRHGRAHGIAAARNAGLACCQAPYVAVLDHDDLSLPQRLAAQADYLDSHPGTVLVGTAVRILNAGKDVASGQPARVAPAGLRLLLHLGNPLTWSSVMFRRDALEAVAVGGETLRQSAEPADDYDLYHRLMALGEVARLDQVLTQYRWHSSNTSHSMAAQIRARAAWVLARAYAPWFGAEAEAEATLVIRHLSDRSPVPDAATLDRLLATIARVACELGGDVQGLAAAMQWSVLRAAVRGGRPELVRGRWRHAGGPADTLASVAIGGIRAAHRRLRA